MAKGGKGGFSNNDPILIASTGSLKGLLNSPIPDTQSSPPVLLALADPPSDADLAETIEIKFTPAIQAKAQELGNNPVKIYNWVRNNIEFVPTYGSIQGADMCLQTKQCNDFDTASLLIALLRASGIHARYVYGTIEIPIEKVMNWIGGFTDKNSALTMIATGGIPVSGLTEGGQIKYAQIEHIWVEAWIDMTPSFGSVHKQGDTWLPLDASFKQHVYKPGIDFHADMAINGVQYISDYIDSIGSPADSQAIDSPSQFYFNRFFSIYENKYPDLWTWDIFGSHRIEATKLLDDQEFEILFETLPYKVQTKAWVNSSVPDTYWHRMNISLNPVDDSVNLLYYSSGIADISGKEITLSFIPATVTDQALLQSYGNDIFAVPAYLLQMRPVIRVNGITVMTGSPIGLGAQIELVTANIGPSTNDTERNIITAGDFIAIATVSNNTDETFVADKMEGLSSKIFASYGEGTVPDDLIGSYLYSIGVMYFHRLSFDEKIVAKNFQLAALRKTGNAIITAEAEPEYIFGVPLRVVNGGISIDVDRNIFSVFPLDGNQARKKDFMIVTGLGSSDWESRVLQILTGTPAVSASILLKVAKSQGIEIYNVDRDNIDAIIPLLEVASEVKQDIKNALNAGKKVIVPKTNIFYNGFNGVGYIIIDPVTGGGAYMIAGGLAGGRVNNFPRDWSAFQTIYTRDAIVQLAWALDRYPYVWGGEGYPVPECGFDCTGLVHYLYTTVYGSMIWGTYDYFEDWPLHPRPYGETRRITLEKLVELCTEQNWWHPYEEREAGDILFSNDDPDTSITDYGHANIIDIDNIDYSWSAAGNTSCETAPEPVVPELCEDFILKGPVCPGSKVKRTANETLIGGHSDQICRPLPGLQ